MEKVCPCCRQNKSFNEYWKNQSACIVCTKTKRKTVWKSRTPKKRLEQHLKYKYGVTHQVFLNVWEEQKGCCAICTDPLPDLLKYNQRKRNYAIDHNHTTGDFRGILCLKCNSLLGMARDSIQTLKNAVKYLQERGSYGQ